MPLNNSSHQDRWSVCVDAPCRAPGRRPVLSPGRESLGSLGHSADRGTVAKTRCVAKQVMVIRKDVSQKSGSNFRGLLRLRSAWISVHLFDQGLVISGAPGHGHGVADGQQGWNWMVARFILRLMIERNTAQSRCHLSIYLSAAEDSQVRFVSFRESGSSSRAKYRCEAMCTLMQPAA